MLEVKVDLLKNRLYITLGRIQKNRVKNAYEVVEKAAKKLASGFTCVTRIIDARDIDQNDIDEIIRIQMMLADLGMSKAIRVGVENGKLLLKQVGKGTEYIATDAATLDKAEQMLDNWEKTTRCNEDKPWK
ncbi:MAG: hypothetical protein HF978_05875 [Desulfobacteraceae bacterium]|nr:hypothetical protein [Desulfobacteraceae bacterium]MBC2755062.1 hypothetical protein [Desulfobacteraceae bacterium]